MLHAITPLLNKNQTRVNILDKFVFNNEVDISHHELFTDNSFEFQ